MLWQRLNRKTLLTLTLGMLLALGGLSRLASAATINYGNFGPVPPGITFVDVRESVASGPLPLYGPPTAFSVGLKFTPTADFRAVSSGGVAPNPAITDGQLNFSIEATDPVAIDTFSLFERGDYTLFAAGPTINPAFTSVSATLAIIVTVTQVDGIDISPQALEPFAIPPTFSATLASNPGVGNIWSLNPTYDVSGALTTAGIPFTLGATRIDVAIDNILIATSVAGTQEFAPSLAQITKKEFRVDVGTKIPEPTALVMLIGCCFSLGAVARRSRT